MKLIAKFALLFSLFFSFTDLCAQEDKASKERKVHSIKKKQFGIRGGLNVSNMSGIDINRDQALLGFHVGGYVQFPISNDQLILETGAYYSQKGYSKATVFGDEAQFTLQAEAVGSDAPGELLLNFVDIPIILKDNQFENFSPFGGIEWNVLLDSEYNYSYLNEAEELITDRQTNLSDLKNVNLSAVLGLEYHVNHFFNLNISYYYSFSTIDKGNNLKLKINTIKISGGFSF